MIHGNVALGCELLNRWRSLEICRDVENRALRQFRIDHRTAIGDGARERIPAGRDVAANSSHGKNINIGTGGGSRKGFQSQKAYQDPNRKLQSSHPSTPLWPLQSKLSIVFCEP